MLGFVPMPHKAKILRAAAALDEWGLPIDTGDFETLKCKVSYNSNRETVSVASGELVVYQVRILFEGIPQISYSDVIEWSDDWGNVHKKQPLTIDYLHDLSGAAIGVRVTL